MPASPSLILFAPESTQQEYPELSGLRVLCGLRTLPYAFGGTLWFWQNIFSGS